MLKTVDQLQKPDREVSEQFILIGRLTLLFIVALLFVAVWARVSWGEERKLISPYVCSHDRALTLLNEEQALWSDIVEKDLLLFDADVGRLNPNLRAQGMLTPHLNRQKEITRKIREVLEKQCAYNPNGQDVSYEGGKP